MSYNNTVLSLKDEMRIIETKCSTLETHEKVLKRQLEGDANGENRIILHNLHEDSGHLRDVGVQFPSDSRRIGKLLSIILL